MYVVHLAVYDKDHCLPPALMMV